MNIQMCTVGDITGEECQCIAQWEWATVDDDHPVWLCNFHAEPLIADMVANDVSSE